MFILFSAHFLSVCFYVAAFKFLLYVIIDVIVLVVFVDYIESFLLSFQALRPKELKFRQQKS